MNALSTLDLRDATSVCRTPIHDFVEHHWPALRHAADFLGGRRAIAEADRLFGDLARSFEIGTHTRRRIERLIRLLELDDEVVSGDHMLTLVNPSDPIVEELCLLLDGLRQAFDMFIGEQAAA
ncbi:hypothetical protein [Phaeovulum sp.]|uniref:hypothetical protein n=1 Tax=Phaeovulum sp. TaxID=2934796 RepID=UPI0039E6E2DE